MDKPFVFDTNFNVAILQLCNHVLPAGFDRTATPVPMSLQELNDCVAATGRISVWPGASEETIYGDPEVNIAFRAWHNWVHFRYQIPFTFEGEVKAAHIQLSQMIRLFGYTTNTVRWGAVLFAEVIGQAAFYEAHKDFPIDQVRFSLRVATGFVRMVERLCRTMRNGYGSDEAAIALAKASYQELKEMPEKMAQFPMLAKKQELLLV